MRHDVSKLLNDILDAGEFVRQCVEGRTFESFAADRLLFQAIERNFEIIGEAFNRIARQYPEVATRIGEHSRVIAFRNILAHAYDGVDSEVVWSIIHDHLPNLLARVINILEETKPNG
jgi:uncharacterized protein with HEPN domain